MEYRDVTQEFINSIEDEANEETFRLVREIVGIMIANERAEALEIYHRNKGREPIRGGERRPENSRAWQSIKDYDTIYAQWEATRYERSGTTELEQEEAIIKVVGLDAAKAGRRPNDVEYIHEKKRKYPEVIIMSKQAVDRISEWYRTNGHEDTKELVAKMEAQRKEAAKALDKLVEERNPVAMLMKGFMEQGKQNEKRNETRIDFYKGDDDGHNMKFE